MIYALTVSFFILLAGLLFAARRSGREAERLDDETAKNNTTVRANALRDRLKSDGSFAARVRKRFTR